MTADRMLDADGWLDEGRAVVRVGGEVDVYNAQLLRTVLNEILDQAPRPLLALELSELGFCDSSGLGVLVNALKRVRQDGGRMAVCGVHDPVLKLLRITGLDKVFGVVDGLEDALRVLDAHEVRK